MDLNKIFNEAIGDLWNSSNYGGTSEAPRKDFGPGGNEYGYNFSYQKNSPLGIPPQDAGPDMPSNVAWPLQTVTKDLSEGFVGVLAAANKIENCLNLNKAVSEEQFHKLQKMSEFATKILSAIKTLDANIEKYLQLSDTSNYSGTASLPPEKKIKKA